MPKILILGMSHVEAIAAALTPAEATQVHCVNLRNVGWIWLWIGLGGLVVRTVHLFLLRDVRTGLVWATKIITDPLHDAWIYRGAPLALLRGELIDPMDHAATRPRGGGRV